MLRLRESLLGLYTLESRVLLRLRGHTLNEWSVDPSLLVVVYLPYLGTSYFNSLSRMCLEFKVITI